MLHSRRLTSTQQWLIVCHVYSNIDIPLAVFYSALYYSALFLSPPHMHVIKFISIRIKLLVVFHKKIFFAFCYT